MITDSYGRKINYLRLAVTDRCNLRCTYCMPEEGLNWLSQSVRMTNEEMLRICSLFVRMGIEKIRITGGEPFVRKDLMPFLKRLSLIDGLKELTITTNGLLVAPFVSELKNIGIKSINLSLDTLDEERFELISKRKGLDKVLEIMHLLLENGIKVSINTVVMENRNIADIIPLVQLTETLPISVRFIEEMPFNGSTESVSLKWDFVQILKYIKGHFPNMEKIVDKVNATSSNYKIPNYKGDIGIIAAYTRSFCGSCNRIRITPTGVLRTCLYEEGTLNIKEAMRNGSSDEEIKDLIMHSIQKKAKDGWEAQNKSIAESTVHESMATIGG